MKYPLKTLIFLALLISIAGGTLLSFSVETRRVETTTYNMANEIISEHSRLDADLPDKIAMSILLSGLASFLLIGVILHFNPDYELNQK